MSEPKVLHEHQPTGKIALDPEKAEEGLSQLVMTVVELLRQLVERQAMRRVENGSLTEEEIERVGEALLNLEEKMEELKEIFQLDDDDLNIDLGPLGNLM
ncbi:gas vesicle protein K [Alteribacillus iranensis]|uniref:Gas vesicle protein K n=1 Tax=Alteribacillus iranensis TaxID=930128 RepID=A0A1I2ACZ3_9BACI|nr:gas vesicle protein K [Alteribacillus iranensis]SFE41418.1 Gas vesicle protein K [Alteribacillus iranensis]